MNKILLGAVAASALLGATAANAATSFLLQIAPNGANYDTPYFTLYNTSSTASLTSFSLDFGPSSWNIDRAVSFTRIGDAPPQLTWTVTSPDTSDNGQRADGLWINFTGFGAKDPDEGLKFQVDFDRDAAPQQISNADFRNILFNNGASNNAVLKVGFSDGTLLTQTLGDGPLQTSYSYTGSNAVAAVPEPTTWAMMLIGFFGLGSVMRRKREGLAVAAA